MPVLRWAIHRASVSRVVAIVFWMVTADAAFASPRAGPIGAEAATANRDDLPHRVTATLGLAAPLFDATVGGQDDGHRASGLGTLVGAGYAYTVVHGFEAGATLDYWTNPTAQNGARDVYHIVMPMLALRLCVPATNWEVGLSAQAGALVLSIRGAPGQWIGWGLRVGPEIRFWMDRSFGLQLGIPFAYGTGTRPENDPAIVNPSPLCPGCSYNIGPVASFTAIGVALGSTWAF